MLRKAKAKLWAFAKSKKPNAVMSTVKAITGRLPRRSLMVPQNGENTKFISA
ncbi:MAG: hypothetical protein IPI72_02335 [Flavobacteriales bacterium]|nr:hypothetical protein [Flavobacteriales bacterium]